MGPIATGKLYDLVTSAALVTTCRALHLRLVHSPSLYAALIENCVGRVYVRVEVDVAVKRFSFFWSFANIELQLGKRGSQT